MPRASDALIAMASRHIAESDIRISAQMERIERLKQIGAGTTEAEEFLKLFKVSMEGRQDLLRKLTYCHDLSPTSNTAAIRVNPRSCPAHDPDRRNQ